MSDKSPIENLMANREFRKAFERDHASCEFANKLCEIRDERGWSKFKLARKMKISTLKLRGILEGSVSVTLSEAAAIMFEIGYVMDLDFALIEDRPRFAKKDSTP